MKAHLMILAIASLILGMALNDTAADIPVDRAKVSNACWQLGVWSQARSGYTLGRDGFCNTDSPCLAPVDVIGSSGVDIDDVVYRIAHIFQGGPSPQQVPC